jgi:hypothetical protein
VIAPVAGREPAETAVSHGNLIGGQRFRLSKKAGSATAAPHGRTGRRPISRAALSACSKLRTSSARRKRAYGRPYEVIWESKRTYVRAVDKVARLALGWVEVTRALDHMEKCACLALLVAGLTVGSACAADSNEQSNPADQKFAQRLIMHFQDMPSGWGVEPPTKSHNACRHLLAKLKGDRHREG